MAKTVEFKVGQRVGIKASKQIAVIDYVYRNIFLQRRYKILYQLPNGRMNQVGDMKPETLVEAKSGMRLVETDG